MSSTKEAKTAEKKSPPMMLMVVAIAVLAIGAGLFFGKQVSAKSKEATKKGVPGPIMPLDEFLVNLADPSGDHFLKVTVALELSPASGKTPDTLKDRVPEIRDAVLSALTSRTRDQVSSGAGREGLKADIKKDVNASLGESDVKGVYFSDFVTQ